MMNFSLLSKKYRKKKYAAGISGCEKKFKIMKLIFDNIEKMAPVFINLK